MPDWKHPDEIQKEAGVFMKLMHSLAGIYMCYFPSLFLFVLLTYPQVRVVYIPRLWMGFYFQEEEVPLAHGQHCLCPQLKCSTTHQHTDILFCQPISPALCDHWNVGESTFHREILFDKSWQYCFIGQNRVRLPNSDSSCLSSLHEENSTVKHYTLSIRYLQSD